MEEGPKTRVSPSGDDDDDDVPVTQIRGDELPPALTPADPRGAADEAAAASHDSDGSARDDDDSDPCARGDTVFGYEPNPADGIVAILNPNATLPADVLPIYKFLHMDAQDPALCGPLKRPEFEEDPTMTQRFSRQILLEEQHHAKSHFKRDLFSDESCRLMAIMTMDVAKIQKLPCISCLLDREAQSWSVKVAVLRAIDKASGRKQEVHPPCKATWCTETNYVMYGKKIGILFAMTDATDTTVLDLAAGGGGTRLKSRMEELLYRWSYVLFFVEVPKTEEGKASTYKVTMIPNQYDLATPFEGDYKCDGSNASGTTMPDRKHVLVVPRFTAFEMSKKHRCLNRAFGEPKGKGASGYSRSDSDDPRTFWLADAPVDFVALREHCDTIRKFINFGMKVWNLPMYVSRKRPHALDNVDKADGKDIGMLYQEQSSLGHQDYEDYASFEEVPGLAHLKVRKNTEHEEGGPVAYSVTIYESPYFAYGEWEFTREEFLAWCEERHACFIEEARFDDVGDKTFLDEVPRRYSDVGEILVDPRRLSSMQQDEFVELALNKHRYPKNSNNRKRCLWSNEQLSTGTGDDKQCWFDAHSGWSFFQRQGLELCYVEVEARQWEDKDNPNCAGDGSDIIAVELTIVFDGGRTEKVALSICGGTISWLPNELDVAACFFLAVDDGEDEMFGPLPPDIPTKQQHEKRHKEGLVRWQKNCDECEKQGKKPARVEDSYQTVLYSEPLPRESLSAEYAYLVADAAAETDASAAAAAAPPATAASTATAAAPAATAALAAAAAAPAATDASAAAAAAPAAAKAASGFLSYGARRLPLGEDDDDDFEEDDADAATAAPLRTRSRRKRPLPTDDGDDDDDDSGSGGADGAQFSPLEEFPTRKRRSQLEKLEEDLDNEEPGRLQDERDDTGKNGDGGGAAAGGITVAGSAVDDEPKCLLLGELEVPWTDLTSWQGELVANDNNFLAPYDDLQGGDYRNWHTKVIRAGGSHLYFARLTMPPPGTPVSALLPTGVGLKPENLQGLSAVDTSSIFSATRKEVLLIFHKGVIEMNRGNGVPKIAAGQFAKVKHATATSPHIYGLVVAVAHTPESSGVPNFLGGVRVVLAMAVADRNATVATGDKGVEIVFLERSQIEMQPAETDHLHMHFSTQRTRPQGPINMKAWATSDLVKRTVTTFLANPMLTDQNTYKMTKSKGIFKVQWPLPTAAAASTADQAASARGGRAGGRGIRIVPAATGAGAADGAAAQAAADEAAAAAAAAAAGASGTPDPGDPGASAAARAAAEKRRHGLAKKQQETEKRQKEQQAEIEKLTKAIASVKDTQQQPNSAQATQIADLKKLVSDVQLLHRNSADGRGGAASRGGGGGRGASRGAAGNSGGADGFITETRTITTSTSPTKHPESDHSALDKVIKLQSEHSEKITKMAEMTQQVTRV